MLTKLPPEEKAIISRLKFAEENFIQLLQTKDLDRIIKEKSSTIKSFRDILSAAIQRAYENDQACEKTHLFLQRILYYINRLKFFWFDKLENYDNEDSIVIQEIRLEIEKSWTSWENKKITIESKGYSNVRALLEARFEADLNPLPDDDALFIRNEISILGYKRLLAIASLDGLVEASQLSRTLGGAGNKIQLMLAKILWEEYGAGKLSHKHSSYFADMLRECDMKTAPETYFNIVPWEVLANINHSFNLSERKRNYLRYTGGLLYTEVSAPSSFFNYYKAGTRIGLSKRGTSYWDVHTKEDIRHGKWMLNDVTLPLAEQYKEDAWQIIWGYDQQKFFSTRATKATIKSIRSLKNY